MQHFRRATFGTSAGEILRKCPFLLMLQMSLKAECQVGVLFAKPHIVINPEIKCNIIITGAPRMNDPGKERKKDCTQSQPTSK